LEKEILKFPEITIKTNKLYYFIQKPLSLKHNILKDFGESRCISMNVCKVNHSKIPIIMKMKTAFLLTGKTIKLVQNNKYKY
jgi:hypothetical protein